MLPDERGLWTNYSGTVEYGPKEEFPAPKGYHWVEDNWRLDGVGPWIDEKLNLGTCCVYLYFITYYFF